ncbi:hypothetical protein IFM89_008518 [Coptis chinensis]|uniref:Pleiotropic ABC efflux transporter N-terminal domain-containing protein n=1 Tax=Coptis chinensis TaxID=261450 RepID=A0A835HL64_9MAGN|nr:hypothetical protein IFM89_008518 [Coptis chinensis]
MGPSVQQWVQTMGTKYDVLSIRLKPSSSTAVHLKLEDLSVFSNYFATISGKVSNLLSLCRRRVVTVRNASGIWRNTNDDVFTRSSRDEDDKEALKWAAIEILPTYSRIRKKRLVRVAEDDNEKFLLKLKERMDRVGIENPTIEVRFEHLSVSAEAYIGSRALPTVINVPVNMAENDFVIWSSRVCLSASSTQGTSFTVQFTQVLLAASSSTLTCLHLQRWRGGYRYCCAGMLGKDDPRPVQHDSLYPVFSVTKGVTAGMLHWLVDNRGCLISLKTGMMIERAMDDHQMLFATFEDPRAEHDVELTVDDYPFAYDGCCQYGRLIRKGGIPDKRTYLILVSRWCLAGSLKEAHVFLEEMSRKGFNPPVRGRDILIDGLLSAGYLEATKGLVRKMTKEEFLLDITTFNLLLEAICEGG